MRSTPTPQQIDDYIAALRARARRRKRLSEHDGVAFCTGCKQTKPTANFTRRTDTGRLRSKCRQCAMPAGVASTTRWRQRHPAQYKQIRAAWKAKNPTANQVYRKRYAARHPDRVAASSARWFLKFISRRPDFLLAWARNVVPFDDVRDLAAPGLNPFEMLALKEEAQMQEAA